MHPWFISSNFGLQVYPLYDLVALIQFFAELVFCMICHRCYYAMQIFIKLKNLKTNLVSSAFVPVLNPFSQSIMPRSSASNIKILTPPLSIVGNKIGRVSLNKSKRWSEVLVIDWKWKMNSIFQYKKKQTIHVSRDMHNYM